MLGKWFGVLALSCTTAWAEQHAFLAGVMNPIQGDLRGNSESEISGRVVRCRIQTAQEAERLAALVQEHEWDIWSNEQFRTSEPIDIRIPIAISDGNIGLDAFDCVDWIPSVQNLVSHVDLMSQSVDTSSFPTEDQFYAEFHPFDDLIAHVNELVAEFPHLTRLIPSIGKTHEGRDIPVIHISATKSPKKLMWFNGGIHAREWISSHVAMYQLEHLLTEYGKNAVVTKALDNYEFIVSPHINPDGYEYSRTKNRMYRKNRRANKDGSFGVDLNRNFDWMWGRGGSSGYPGSDTYRGPRPASEPEVAALQNYISKLGPIAVSIDFHSYGQLIMRPYGYTMDDHPTEPNNKALGDAMRDAMYTTTKTRYTSQKSAGLYPVTGGFDDWMTEVKKTVGFTIELRDRGMYGFVLPPQYIFPTCQEVWAAMQVLMSRLEDF